MKAIRAHEFGEPNVLRLEEVPDPAPGPDEVLVRVNAAGVNPYETYIRAGKYARLPALPYTPGSDAAGVVEAVGSNVKTVSVGQRVYTHGTVSGSYAEKALCQASQVYALPERISFPQGAALGVPYGTAYRALFQRGAGLPGEYVLIHGATGGVGTAAVQLGRAAGMIVIGTAGSDRGRQLAAEQGAHHAIGHDEAVDPERVKALTGGHGIDLIVEMLANVNLGRDLGVLARSGRVVVVGSRGPVEIDPRNTMALEADIRGLMLNNGTPDEMRVMRAALGAGLEGGTLHPVVGETMPLAEAARAHEAVMKEGAYGKIVLLP